jgi:uncharacterized protein (TIGR00645 family)
VERFIETLMVRARWLLAPVYLGLSLALLALAFKFFQEAIHLIVHVIELKEADLVLIILSLIDMAMVGGLLVMVMMSGYENFVSKIETDDATDGLSWLGKMDASTLKLKVAANIVAISSIHLLKVFMNIENIDSEKLTWYVVIHITFVASAFSMGMLEKWTKDAH